jgi:hypothetical protein
MFDGTVTVAVPVDVPDTPNAGTELDQIRRSLPSFTGFADR